MFKAVSKEDRKSTTYYRNHATSTDIGGREGGRRLKLAKIKTQSGSQSTTYLRGRHPGVRGTWEWGNSLSSGVGMQNRPSRVGGEGEHSLFINAIIFFAKR